jgi:hypothetical protein
MNSGNVASGAVYESLQQSVNGPPLPVFVLDVNGESFRVRRSFALGPPQRGHMHSDSQQLWLAWRAGEIDDRTAQIAAEAFAAAEARAR